MLGEMLNPICMHKCDGNQSNSIKEGCPQVDFFYFWGSPFSCAFFTPYRHVIKNGSE